MKSFESQIVWIAKPGMPAPRVIEEAIAEAKAQVEHRWYRVLINDIVLKVDADSLAADVLDEFRARATRSEGAYWKLWEKST